MGFGTVFAPSRLRGFERDFSRSERRPSSPPRVLRKAPPPSRLPVRNESSSGPRGTRPRSATTSLLEARTSVSSPDAGLYRSAYEVSGCADFDTNHEGSRILNRCKASYSAPRELPPSELTRPSLHSRIPPFEITKQRRGSEADVARPTLGAPKRSFVVYGYGPGQVHPSKLPIGSPGAARRRLRLGDPAWFSDEKTTRVRQWGTAQVNPRLRRDNRRVGRVFDADKEITVESQMDLILDKETSGQDEDSDDNTSIYTVDESDYFGVQDSTSTVSDSATSSISEHPVRQSIGEFDGDAIHALNKRIRVAEHIVQQHERTLAKIVEELPEPFNGGNTALAVATITTHCTSPASKNAVDRLTNWGKLRLYLSAVLHCTARAKVSEQALESAEKRADYWKAQADKLRAQNESLRARLRARPAAREAMRDDDRY